MSVEIQLQKLVWPPVNGMLESPLLGDKTETLQDDVEEHEYAITVGKESLTSDISSQIQEQSNAGTEGKGDIDFGKEGSVSGWQSKALDTD